MEREAAENTGDLPAHREAPCYCTRILTVRDHIARQVHEAGEQICRACIPIFRDSIEGFPFYVGCGFLLSVDAVPYLVTAAHVLDPPSPHSAPDGYRPGYVLTRFPTEDYLFRLRGQSVRTPAPSGGLNRDGLGGTDLGIVRLSNEEVAKIGAERFLPSGMLEASPSSDSNINFLVSIPDLEGDLDAKKGKVDPVISIFRALEQPADPTGIYRNHLRLRWEPEEQTWNGVHTKGEGLQGRSGGLVARLLNPTRPIQSRSDLSISGIFTDAHLEGGCLYCVRADSLIALFRHFHPDSEELPRVPAVPAFASLKFQPIP